MITTAGLHKAIVGVWDAHGLEAVFNQYWSVVNRQEFSAFHEQEAGPSQPWPYAIFTAEPGDIITRMAGNSEHDGGYLTKDVQFSFQVFARTFSGSGKSAKVIAAELITEIMARYGGHPTAAPQDMTMDYGEVLLVQYQTDFPTREGDDEYSWTVNYMARLDVPVAL